MDDNDSKELLNVIDRNVYFMKELVDKTIELARLNSTKIEFSIEKTNLYNEAENAVLTNQIILVRNHIVVNNKIDDRIFIKADKLRLGELFNNLITNAVKYSESDQGTITLDANEDADFITISVSDTGIGINQQQINNIFDEFFKADESRHNLDSSGLGLAICKRIVEKHGGKIWVNSPGVGKGSTFFFTMKKA